MKSTKMMQKAQSGFTLIELMIVVAIIGILAAIAIPSYQQYTKKAKFTEVIQATSAVKTAVEICANDLGTLTGCSGNSNGIPADIAAAVGKVATLAALNGQITATAINSGGLGGENVILTPTMNSTTKTVTWAIDATSTCKTATPAIC
jgi:type IV pilus assembly protein PilA